MVVGEHVGAHLHLDAWLSRFWSMSRESDGWLQSWVIDRVLWTQAFLSHDGVIMWARSRYLGDV